jgi:hypothetical protein
VNTVTPKRDGSGLSSSNSANPPTEPVYISLNVDAIYDDSKLWYNTYGNYLGDYSEYKI